MVAAARASRRKPLEPRMQPAPELKTIRWFNSPPSTLSAMRGRVVLLDFWATWCAPCVAAHRNVKELADRFRGAPFSVVLVHANVTRRRDPGKARFEEIPAEEVLPRFVMEHGIKLPVAVADKGQFDLFNVGPIPHYVVIDKRGFIRYSRVAKLPSESELQALIDE